VPVACPSHVITEPLMGDLMEGNDLVEVFLRFSAKADTLLFGGRQKGKGRQINQARPTLAEIPGNLRNLKVREGKRPEPMLLNPHRIGNHLSDLMDECSRAWFLGGARLKLKLNRWGAAA